MISIVNNANKNLNPYKTVRLVEIVTEGYRNYDQIPDRPRAQYLRNVIIKSDDWTRQVQRRIKHVREIIWQRIILLLATKLDPISL